MSNDTDRNYISVGSWMWIIFVTALPCIGLIMVIVWAFSGENESRKNYFRAMLVWLLIAIVVGVALGLAGQLPQAQKALEDFRHKK